MSKPLQVGERVAVYGHISRRDRFTGVVHEKSSDEVNDKFKSDNFVLVYDEEYPFSGYYCHRKQCRRLTKKPRRTLTAIYENYGLSIDVYSGSYKEGESAEFIEVRRKC